MTARLDANVLIRFLTKEPIEQAERSATLIAAIGIGREQVGRRNLDFADALLAAKALRSDDPVIYSFDRDFDATPGLVRKEP